MRYNNSYREGVESILSIGDVAMLVIILLLIAERLMWSMQ